MWAWLVAIAGPIVKRVLVALGIGVVSYAGLNAVMSQVQSAVTNAWGQMGTVTLQLLTLAGFSDALGIALGALAARLALVSLSHFGRVAD